MPLGVSSRRAQIETMLHFLLPLDHGFQSCRVRDKYVLEKLHQFFSDEDRVVVWEFEIVYRYNDLSTQLSAQSNGHDQFIRLCTQAVIIFSFDSFSDVVDDGSDVVWSEAPS